MARTTLPHVDLGEAGATLVKRPSSASSLLASLRPGQWTKNLIVFAALIFAQRLLDPRAVALSAAAFVIFCMLSGVVYLLNDLLDRTPIASIRSSVIVRSPPERSPPGPPSSGRRRSARER